ncbi:MAG: TetR/AcrR family transcriptional regulator [Pelosinus sp.]|nr:TetR/AcrR family transcriptional regulator [Pelosinus sp.]
MVQKKATEVRRDEIVAAAMVLVEQKGLDNVNIADIAAAINLVPSAIYRHFAKKEEIIEALIEFVNKVLQDNVCQAMRKETHALARLKLLLNLHVQLFKEQRAIPRILFTLLSSDKDAALKQKMLSVIACYLAKVELILEEGRSNGEINNIDAKAGALLFLGMVQPLAIMTQFEEDAINYYPEKLWNIYLHGINCGKAK